MRGEHGTGGAGREWRHHANLDAVLPRVDDDARRGRAEEGEGVAQLWPLISIVWEGDLSNARAGSMVSGQFSACRTRAFNKWAAHRARDPGGQFRHACAQGLAMSDEASSGHGRVLHGKGVLQRPQRAAFRGKTRSFLAGSPCVTAK